jgi:hypothetical protein
VTPAAAATATTAASAATSPAPSVRRGTTPAPLPLTLPLPLPLLLPTAPLEQLSGGLDGAQGASRHAGTGGACPVAAQEMSTAAATPAHGKTSSPAAQDGPMKKLIIRLKRSPASNNISNTTGPAHVIPPPSTPLTPMPPEAPLTGSRAAVERDAAGAGMATDTRAAAPSVQPSPPAAALTSQSNERTDKAVGPGITGQVQPGVDDILRHLHALDTFWTEPGACLVPHTQLSLDGPPVVADDDGEAALPPAGEECQLPDDFISAYGVQSTQVLSSNEPLLWWVCMP